MNPVRWLARLFSTVAYKAEPRSREIAFVARWLANNLWQIDTTWRSLVKETYGSNTVAYSAVRMLSQSIPEARLTAYTGEGETRKELPTTHPLRMLLRSPNELMTGFERDELMTIQMSVVGRTVWWKERNVGGGVMAMWPLRPDRVGPVYSEDTTLGKRVLAGYAYVPPDGVVPILLKREDCLACNFPDPDGESGGMVEGFGPLCVASRQISADNKATDHVGSLLANYAQPGVALKMQGEIPNEVTANLIKAKYKQEFGGAKLGEPALLDAGAEIQLLGFNLQQLEFPELRANAEARICAALGVPAILAGVKVGLDRSTFSNMSEARQFFAETTLSWYWRRYADVFTNQLASEFGEDIVCEYDTSDVRALAGQKVERLAPIKDAFSAGVITRNEYRFALRLDPFDDPLVGDMLMVPSNVTAVPATEEARKKAEEQKAEDEEAAQKKLDAMPPPQAIAPPQVRPMLPPGRPVEEPDDDEEPAPAKSADVIVIPIDDELAAALGTKAGGYLVTRNGRGG